MFKFGVAFSAIAVFLVGFMFALVVPTRDTQLIVMLIALVGTMNILVLGAATEGIISALKDRASEDAKV